jgi:hypothetical protein
VASEDHDPSTDHRENLTSHAVKYLLAVEGILPELLVTMTP